MVHGSYLWSLAVDSNYLFNQLGHEKTGSYKLEPAPDTPEMRMAYVT